MINKYIILPLILVGCTAPVTDPPAHACSPRLDGELPTKPLIPKEQVKGEIDIWNPHQIQGLQMMFMRNARRQLIEENATLPSDAINNALDNFWEQEHGSNGSTEQEKLL